MIRVGFDRFHHHPGGGGRKLPGKDLSVISLAACRLFLSKPGGCA